jgi:Fe-S cluster assembly protein SufD
MSALLESLLAAPPPAGAGTLSLARAQALRDARAAGLPSARNEAWKYTSLRALERRTFANVAPPTKIGESASHAAAPPVSGVDSTATASTWPATDTLPDGPRLVFVNGRLDPTSCRFGTADGVLLQPLSRAVSVGDAAVLEALGRRYQGAADIFAALNAGLAADGAHVRVAPGVDGGTLHLVFIGATAPDSAWHLRHLIDVGSDARLTLCEHRIGQGAAAHLANEIAHVALAPRAMLRHARVQQEAAAATAFLRTEAVLAEQATYRRLDLELGAGLSRHELNVALAGAGARLQANGVLLASERRHLDTRLGIEHRARDTSSHLTWRAIGAGRGRAVFHGGILIHAGADGSQAQLANKNLLLSEGAEIDTQPVLEIHADEVKAAHGATVGRLNENALFYLRSRGIPEAQARALLTAAFVREVLDVIDDEAAVERLAARLQAAMDTLS